VLKILENTSSSPYCTRWLFDIVPIWEMHQLQLPLWSWSVKLTWQSNTMSSQQKETKTHCNTKGMTDKLHDKWGGRSVCARDMASAGRDRVGWSGVGVRVSWHVPEGLCGRHPTLHSRCHVAIHSRSHQLQNMRKIQLSLILRTLMTQ